MASTSCDSMLLGFTPGWRVHEGLGSSPSPSLCFLLDFVSSRYCFLLVTFLLFMVLEDRGFWDRDNVVVFHDGLWMGGLLLSVIGFC